MTSTLGNETLKNVKPEGQGLPLELITKSHFDVVHCGSSYLSVGVFQLPQESHIREEVPLRSYTGNRTCGVCNRRSVSE